MPFCPGSGVHVQDFGLKNVRHVQQRVSSPGRQRRMLAIGLESRNCWRQPLTTTTEAAIKAATVVAFPEPEDDLIPLITGFPLVDADAKIIARRLRRVSWEDRAQFFHNIISDSLDNWGKLQDLAPNLDAAAELLDCALLEMQRKIAETLDLWNEPEVTSPHAAAIYELSLKVEHRRAAGTWRLSQNPVWGAPEVFMDTWTQEEWSTLAIFHRLIRSQAPGSTLLWKMGPTKCPTADWPAPADPSSPAAA